MSVRIRTRTTFAMPLASAPTVVRLALIGAPSLAAGDVPPRPLERKDAALLAYLAVEGPSPRDGVAALLWPDVALRGANTNLRQRIFRLRRECGHPLVETGGVLRLARGVTVDLDAPPDPLPEGEVLGGLTYQDVDVLAEWVQAQREKWRRRRRDLLAQSAARHEAAGELARAIDVTEQLVADDPFAEHAQRRLMRLHYLRGDRATAIAVFERFERALKDATGGRPDPETQQLLLTIERAQHAPADRRVVVPASLLRPPRLIGRTDELAALEEIWAAGRNFGLVGEAGMGKSRLMQELVRRHEAVLTVAARPGDAGVPYAALARLLRVVCERFGEVDLGEHRADLARVLPELGLAPPISGEALRLRLQRAIEHLFASAASAGAFALVLDDLHFADSASREVIQALIASPALERLLWGFAQRPGEADEREVALNAGLAESRRLEIVRLGPLEAAQMEELLASLDLPLPGDEGALATMARQLVTHTGGNPLFALETLKTMLLSPAGQRDGLPRPVGVVHLIETRLRQLSAQALTLARVAAVAGEDFSIELAEQVLGAPALALADAWTELESAQVLRGAVFAHDLVQEAALRTLPEAIARHTHAGVAAALEGRGAPPARVAAHWFEAEQWPRAAAAYAQAAALAQAGALRREELALRTRAAVAYERAGDRAAAFQQRCECVDAVAHTSSLDEALSMAERLLPQAESPRQRLDALTALCQVVGVRRETGRLGPLAREALQLAQSLGDTRRGIEAAIHLGQSLTFAGRAELALPLYEQADADAKLLPPGVRSPLLSAHAHALLHLGRREAAAAALRDAITLATESGDLAELSVYGGNLAVVLAELGRAEQALAHAQQARLVQLKVGVSDDAVTACVLDTTAGTMCLRLGRYSEAIELLHRADAGFQRARLAPYAVRAEYALVELWVALGQPARARRAVRTVGDLPPDAAATVWLAARRVDIAVGKRSVPPAPAALAQASVEIQRRVELANGRLLAPREAADAARRLRDVWIGAESFSHALHARVVETKALIDQGAIEAAAGSARALLRAAEGTAIGDAYPGDVWLVAAQALRAGGHEAAAREALRLGQVWIERALSNVPPEFRDSFLDRNPTNRALRQLSR